MDAQQAKILGDFMTPASRLAKLLEGIPGEQLDWRIAKGEWSIRQIVHHLADDLDVWSMCIKKAVATPGAAVRFEDFPGNEPWAEALHFGERPINQQLELILAHRKAVTALAEHFAGAWERSMNIVDSDGEVRATLSVADILKMLTDHMNEHLGTIEQILEKGQGM